MSCTLKKILRVLLIVTLLFKLAILFLELIIYFYYRLSDGQKMHLYRFYIEVSNASKQIIPYFDKIINYAQFINY